LSYRDLEELLAERVIEVDHVTLDRWVQQFTPLLIDAARPSRHLAGDRWFVDETPVKVSGVWSYVYRAVDQHGRVIDVYVSRRRDIGSARTFFIGALTVPGHPAEVTTDRAPALTNVIEDWVPAVLHNTGQYQNNRVDCDHGRLKPRLRPMRGVKTKRTANAVIRGHAFIQNLRRGHYELAVDAAPLLRLTTAFDGLRPAIAICIYGCRGTPRSGQGPWHEAQAGSTLAGSPGSPVPGQRPAGLGRGARPRDRRRGPNGPGGSPVPAGPAHRQA
jgi:transposase, IS6 family